MDKGADSYRRFLAGEDNELADIIESYNAGLTFYINSFVNDLSAADEISEDTFVKLGIKKPHFSGKSSFKTWLYAIGRNVAIDYLRKKSRSSDYSIDDYQQSSCDESVEKEYLKEEQKIMLHKSMQNLKAEHKQVLWLVYFEGFTTKETAKIMKKSVHSIENLLYRARRSLKAVLERSGYTYEDF